jgi:hypothetical protein
MGKLEFWELVWNEFDDLGFASAQFHSLLQSDAFQLRVKHPLDLRILRNIPDFGADG